MEDVKSMLKADMSKHAEQGLILRHIWRNTDDPDEILFIFTTADLNRARKFIEMMQSEALKENPNAKLPQMLFLKGEWGTAWDLKLLSEANLLTSSLNKLISFGIVSYADTYRKHMSDSLHPRDLGVIVRNTQSEDIPKIIDLQKESFPYLARYGNIWHPEELKSHLRIFPQGQFVAVEPDGMVVGSASTLIVLLNPEYAEHTWKGITADGMFTSHNSNGDTLYGADISTHPKHRHEGIGGILYDARKGLIAKLNLRRMIAGGRLFNYSEYAERMSPSEYADKVVKGELKDPVLSFELDNGFRFVKILPNYLDDVRSLNYASFIEWLNPRYQQNR